MKITSNGILPQTKDSIIGEILEDIHNNMDNDIDIAKDGVLDMILQMVADSELNIQKAIEYIASQGDYRLTEGEFQDKLFERIGVDRISPNRTIVIKKIVTNGACFVKSGQILIKTVSGQHKFVNRYSFEVCENDTVLPVEFISVDEGEFALELDEQFKLISAPQEITDVHDSEAQIVLKGRSLENDEEYRVRYKNSKSLNARATHNANIANLSKLVSYPSLLKIYDKNENVQMDDASIHIVAKHNVSDLEWAEAIFSTVAAGVNFIGETTVLVEDVKDNKVPIKFTNAKPLLVSILIKIIPESGVTIQDIRELIINNILEYSKQKEFGISSAIYASEFVIPVLEVEGVESVSETLIKLDGADEYADFVLADYDKYPVFEASSILVEEV